jgi:hypothetical protein
MRTFNTSLIGSNHTTAILNEDLKSIFQIQLLAIKTNNEVRCNNVHIVQQRDLQYANEINEGKNSNI